MVIISLVGDDLARNEYFDRSPELEFLRHLRNAISHGNRWHFVGNEPRRPAAFRQFVLSPALHGSDALFQFMAPGDVADLLLDVGAHLHAYGAAKRAGVDGDEVLDEVRRAESASKDVDHP